MTPSAMPGDEAVVARFRTREELFSHGPYTWRVLLPADAEALIDEEAFESDERLPYWADLWPAAKGLTRHLLDRPPRSTITAIELGCGVALPSLALRAAGVTVTATDYEPHALAFATVNASRNGLSPLLTAVLDWRRIPPDMAPVDLIVGADVLYEPHHAQVIADVLDRLLAPQGRAILAGPGRRHEPALREAMSRRMWQSHVLETRVEGQVGAADNTIIIVELRRVLFGADGAGDNSR